SFVLGRLAGRVQRGESAAVKRVVGAHHDVAAVPAPLAGQLDGALVGLRARVAEEDAAARGAADETVEAGGDVRRDLVAECVRYVAKGVRLFRERVGQLGM